MPGFPMPRLNSPIFARGVSAALVLVVALLVAADVLQLLLLPIVILVRRLRRAKPEADTDGSWILGR